MRTQLCTARGHAPCEAVGTAHVQDSGICVFAFCALGILSRSPPWDSLKMFFMRSVMRSAPAGVISPMSPVWNQPSASSTSLVLSSCL
jgi:hypothetical protein